MESGSTAPRCSSPTPGSPTCSWWPPAPRRTGTGASPRSSSRPARPACRWASRCARWAGTRRTPAKWSWTAAWCRPDAVLGEPNRGFHQIMAAFQLERLDPGRDGRRARRGVPGARDRLRPGPRGVRLAADQPAGDPGTGSPPCRSSSRRPACSPTGRRPGSTAATPSTARSVAMAKYHAAIAANRIIDDVRAALRRRGLPGGDAPSPGTTATPGCCASAAAPTRSSSRSWPRTCPRDLLPATAAPGDGPMRSAAARLGGPNAATTRAAGPDKLPVARPAGRCCSTRARWREDGLLANAGADGLPADGVPDRGGPRRRPAGRRHRARLRRQGGLLGQADRARSRSGSWSGPTVTCSRSSTSSTPRAGGSPSSSASSPAAAAPRASSSSRSRCPGGCRRSAACSARPRPAAPTCRPSPTGSAWSRATRRCTSPRRGWRRRSPVSGPPWRRWAARSCTPPSPAARDEVFDSDWEAIAAARLLLSYLPDSWERRPPAAAAARRPARADWDGRDPGGRVAGYDVARGHRRGSSTPARSSRSRPAGRRRSWSGSPAWTASVVGIVANQPQVRSGAIFVDSADKAARFITLCDAFNIPLVFLHDVPGFMVGVAVERQGIIRHGAKMITAMASAEVPEVLGRPAQELRGRLLRDVRARASSPGPRSRCPRAPIGADGRRGVGQRDVRQQDRRDRRPGGARRVTSPRASPSSAPTSTCCGVASELVVDAVVEPGRPARRARRAAGRRGRLDPRAAAPPPSRQPGLTGGRATSRHRRRMSMADNLEAAAGNAAAAAARGSGARPRRPSCCARPGPGTTSSPDAYWTWVARAAALDAALGHRPRRASSATSATSRAA